jgi:hypothetical protein
LKEPERGSVIRYAYLWADEAARRQSEGLKDRPVVVIAISIVDEGGNKRIYALAVTHSAPSGPDDAVEIPSAVKRTLGLDAERSWVVTREANAFIWPGPDIRIVPGSDPATAIYGRLPTKLLDKVIASYLANSESRLTKIIPRTDAHRAPRKRR